MARKATRSVAQPSVRHAGKGVTRSATKPASRLSPEDRKTDILAVARVVLAEVMHEHFLPITVAERCGVSEGTVYRYFPNKQELLLAIAESWMTEIVTEISQVEANMAASEDIFTRLRFVIHHSLQVVRQQPSITRFIFMNVRIDNNYRNTELYKLVARFTSFTANVVEEGVTLGVFRKDMPIRLIRDIIFGAIEHQTWPFLRNEVGPPLDEVADNIAELIYSGLAVAPPVKAQAVARSMQRVGLALKNIETEMALIKETTGITENNKPVL